MSDSKEDIGENELPKKKGMKLPVLIGVIVGIIILQAGIVMGALKFFAPTVPDDPKSKAKTEQTAHSEEEEAEHGKDGHSEEESEDDGNAALVQKIEGIAITKNDLYVNPRGSSSHICVVSVGLEITPPEKAKEVEDKLMIPIQDRIIARISSFDVDQLYLPEIRDSIRTLIKSDVKPYLRGMSEEEHPVKLRNVFFPKFIIQ